MQLWNWIYRRSKFPLEPFSPRKSSYSSPSTASVGHARHGGALCETAPRLDISRNSYSVTRSKSEKLKAVVDCSTASYSTDHFNSSCDEGSSSSTAVVSAPPQRERLRTGEIIPEIHSHNDNTVPPSLLNELKQVFKKFDTNEDGRISSVELKEVLESLGDHTTDEEAMLMLKEVDANGDGYIDLDDFISMSTGTPDCTSSDELKAAFTMFDLNKEGYITADTLMQVLSSLRAEKYTIQECAKMIKEVDLDGDGRVNFEEFKLMMA